MSYPLPVFRFQVTITGVGLTAQFSEVTGLNAERQMLEYRHGKMKNDPAMKIPSFQKYGNVTLKRGVFQGNQEFFDWFSLTDVALDIGNLVKIDLLDEENKPVMTWELRNAKPTKISVPDLKATGNEVAVESLEFVHEGLTTIAS